METNTIVLLVVAVLGSSALTTVTNNVFRRRNTSAEADKTTAETADILSMATQRTITMMEQNLARAQDRILELEQRVARLEQDNHEYQRLHGPLPPPKLRGEEYR